MRRKPKSGKTSSSSALPSCNGAGIIPEEDGKAVFLKGDLFLRAGIVAIACSYSDFTWAS